MPVYYFDIFSGGKLLTDVEGLDLPDIDAVEKEAATTASAIARDEFSSRKVATVIVQVRDEQGLPVVNSTVMIHTTRLSRPANTGNA